MTAARRSILAILSLLFLSGALEAQETRILRMPDIHGDKVVFAHGGDLWIGDIGAPDGSRPMRLTAGAGDESHPHFSPDGEQVAFTGVYGGSKDVYVVSAAGGQPQRLTWHPGDDIVRGWSPDGSAVLFASPRELSYQRGGRLYLVDVAGGLPRPLPMPLAWDGAYSPDGARIAYQAFPAASEPPAAWDGYRGGMTPDIRLFRLSDHETLRIGGDGSNLHPVWMDGAIYYLADREDGRAVWRHDPETGQARRMTTSGSPGVDWLAGHGGRLVFSSDGWLFLLDAASGERRRLSFSLDADMAGRHPRWVAGKDHVTDAAPAPDGRAAVFAMRGDILRLSGAGAMTRVTASSGAHDRSPLWSPDGRTIAWMSDAGGEYRLRLRGDAGQGLVREIELAGGPAVYRLLTFTPDSRQLIYEDNHLNLYAVELETGESRRIASHARRWFPLGFEVAVSPDSRWLAFTRQAPNYRRVLMLHDLAEGETLQVTLGMGSVGSPAFSNDGRYLYFTASTNSGPADAWLDMSNRGRAILRNVYAAVLAAGDPTPVRSEAPADGATLTADEGGAAPLPETRVDVDGLSRRIVALPLTGRDYTDLAVGRDGALYLMARRPVSGEAPLPGAEEEAVNSIYRYRPDRVDAPLFLSDVSSMRMSADAGALLVGRPDKGWARVAVGESAVVETLKLDEAEVRIDPVAEWRQIFDEVWRLQRDYFYDPDMHGLDWPAVRARFRDWLPHVASRDDLTFLLRKMLAPLRAGHIRVSGGDAPGESDSRTGLLGADYTIENGLYRIARIYSGGRWTPFVTGPLSIPGLGIRAGDYLLAIDGRALTAADNIHRIMEGKRGKSVTLSYSRTPSRRDAVTLIVQPIRSESGLRLWDWISDNRARVDAATDGRVGYVYLPNTAQDGFDLFNRFFFGQLDRQALIVDIRGNRGGQAADYVIETLSRRHLASWSDRDGLPYTTPMGAVFGPKVLLADQFAGSGGDFLAWAFRREGLGPIVGRRTWGGLIGIGIAPELIDGGSVTTPYFRFFTPEGRWAIENEGVAPDISVDMDPATVIAGRDPQLEAAIAEALDRLESFTPPQMTSPPRPAPAEQPR